MIHGLVLKEKLIDKIIKSTFSIPWTPESHLYCRRSPIVHSSPLPQSLQSRNPSSILPFAFLTKISRFKPSQPKARSNSEPENNPLAPFLHQNLSSDLSESPVKLDTQLLERYLLPPTIVTLAHRQSDSAISRPAHLSYPPWRLP